MQLQQKWRILEEKLLEIFVFRLPISQLILTHPNIGSSSTSPKKKFVRDILSATTCDYSWFSIEFGKFYVHVDFADLFDKRPFGEKFVVRGLVVVRAEKNYKQRKSNVFNVENSRKFFGLVSRIVEHHKQAERSAKP